MVTTTLLTLFVTIFLQLEKKHKIVFDIKQSNFLFTASDDPNKKLCLVIDGKKDNFYQNFMFDSGHVQKIKNSSMFFK
jgi:hypothetical protein